MSRLQTMGYLEEPGTVFKKTNKFIGILRMFMKYRFLCMKFENFSNHTFCVYVSFLLRCCFSVSILNVSCP